MGTEGFRHTLPLCSRRKAACCSCSSQHLSVYEALLSHKNQRLMLTYRSMHDVAPVTSAYNDEIEMAPQQRTSRAAYEKGREQLIGKWASMWRSLILSSLGKTLFPYSKYVRTLSLQDLEYLLQDTRFLGNTSG